jgi:hypothetical protein
MPLAAAGTACGWDKVNGLLPPVPCPEPAVATVTEACGHEHVSQARACARHAGGVQLEENWVCSQCATGPRPHDCPAINVITWDDPMAPAVVAGEQASDFTGEPGCDEE